MSRREDIANNIIQTLKANAYTKTGSKWVKHITRESVDFQELSREAFPAVFVETSNEVREDISMGGMGSITRDATIEYILDIYVHGANRDTQLNYCLDMVETALDADRKRGRFADDTQLREIETIVVGEATPYKGVRMVFDVKYCYTTGVA